MAGDCLNTKSSNSARENSNTYFFKFHSLNIEMFLSHLFQFYVWFDAKLNIFRSGEVCMLSVII